MSKTICAKPSECPICFESLQTEKNSLICGHWVHIACAKQQIRDECPLCRTKLNLKDTSLNIERDWFSFPLAFPAAPINHTTYDNDSDLEDESSEEIWQRKGFLYKEEDIDNYDEENPDGDSVYYD